MWCLHAGCRALKMMCIFMWCVCMWDTSCEADPTGISSRVCELYLEEGGGTFAVSGCFDSTLKLLSAADESVRSRGLFLSKTERLKQQIRVCPCVSHSPLGMHMVFYWSFSMWIKYLWNRHKKSGGRLCVFKMSNGMNKFYSSVINPEFAARSQIIWEQAALALLYLLTDLL